MKCPKCGRKVLRAVFDPKALYGKGSTVLFHGQGEPIGNTGLRYADCCNIDGDARPAKGPKQLRMIYR